MRPCQIKSNNNDIDKIPILIQYSYCILVCIAFKCRQLSYSLKHCVYVCVNTIKRFDYNIELLYRYSIMEDNYQHECVCVQYSVKSVDWT